MKSLEITDAGLSPRGEKNWFSAIGDVGESLRVQLASPGLLLAAKGEAEKPWMAGSLACSSVIEVAELLSSASETGALSVHDAEGIRTLFFEHGEFVGSKSTHVSDRLGKVLWRVGKIALDQLMIAEASLTKQKRLGRLLVEMGYVRAKDLREILWTQAREVFLAACIEPQGSFVFVRGLKTKNPIRYGVQTSDLLDDAVDAYQELTTFLGTIAPLDDKCETVVPAPQGALSDNEEALLQLAMSARHGSLTKREVILRSDIGLLEGARGLARLQSGGYFVQKEEAPQGDEVPEDKVAVLCDAINNVMGALRELDESAGAGVRGFLESPPEHLEEVLSGINVSSALDSKNVQLQAGFAEGGVERMERALILVLDFALFEARDRLPEEKSDAIDEELERSGVFA